MASSMRIRSIVVTSSIICIQGDMLCQCFFLNWMRGSLILAQKASRVYYAETRAPWGEAKTLDDVAEDAAVGLMKVRPLTRVPTIEGGECSFGWVDSTGETRFVSMVEGGITAVGIKHPVNGALDRYVDWSCADCTGMRSCSSSSAGVNHSALRSALALPSRGIV